MRPRASTLAPLAACLLTGTLLQACGGGGGGGNNPGAPPGPTLAGMVFDYADQPARDVTLEVLGGVRGRSRIDGLFLLGPVSPGPRVLRVGDSVTTPTLLVPFSAVNGPHQLDRPVFLPALESGIAATLPAAISTSVRIAGDALPGVTLDLPAGTSLAFPGGSAGELRVLGVSPSRLPDPLPGGRAARAAWLIEPFGARLSTPATLTIPRQDPLSSGPFEAWQVSPASGQWELLTSSVALVGSDALSVQVRDGTLVAVTPAAAPTRVAVSGRVVAGTQPVAGFRVSVWDRVSDPTGPDGLFAVQDVPGHYGAFLVRAYPAVPGVDFAPGVTQVVVQAPTLGDVVVQARAPDSIPPTVRQTTPSDGQAGVDRRAQVLVTFSESIDATLSEPVRLVGPQGQVTARLSFDSPFAVRLIPAQPLDPAVTYTIVAATAVQDLAGNPLDDSLLSARFTVAPGAPSPPPTDTAAFGISPLTAVRGGLLSVLGRNFTGGSQVLFGTTAGLVTQETTEEIQVRVPDFQPAGDVTLTVSAGGQTVSALRPLVLDLRASVATIYSGASPDTPLAFLDRAQPPAVIVVDGGNVGGSAVTIDGVSIAAVDSTVPSGAATVATGRTISLPAPAPPTLLTGPVVVRGGNGRPGATYRFLVVRE